MTLAALDEQFLPRLVAVFFATFHPTHGPKVIYQVPEGSITEEKDDADSVPSATTNSAAAATQTEEAIDDKADVEHAHESAVTITADSALDSGVTVRRSDESGEPSTSDPPVSSRERLEVGVDASLEKPALEGQPSKEGDSAGSDAQTESKARKALQPLFSFSSLSDYLIPKAPLCGRLVTCSTRGRSGANGANGATGANGVGRGYKIMGYPVLLEDGARYRRNTFIFNLCFVFDGRADVRAYEPIVRKCGRVLRSLEESSCFLSDAASLPRMYGTIEQLYEDLNSYCESFVAFPEAPSPRPRSRHHSSSSSAQGQTRDRILSTSIKSLRAAAGIEKSSSIISRMEAHGGEKKSSRRSSGASTSHSSGKSELEDDVSLPVDGFEPRSPEITRPSMSRSSTATVTANVTSGPGTSVGTSVPTIPLSLSSSSSSGTVSGSVGGTTELVDSALVNAPPPGGPEAPHGLGRTVRDAINLKLFPTYANPPPAHDWEVPVALLDLSRRVDGNWDLTMAKIFPFINGINHVKRIAQLADADLGLTRQCMEHLLYYGCIIMVDVFQFSNMYTVRPLIARIADDESMRAECAAYVTRPGYPLPSYPSLLHLYSLLRPGRTLHEWIEDLNVDALGIDVRRFVSFGVIKGFVRRVHRYPILLSSSDDADAPGTASNDTVPAPPMMPRPRGSQSDILAGKSDIFTGLVDRRSSGMLNGLERQARERTPTPEGKGRTTGRAANEDLGSQDTTTEILPSRQATRRPGSAAGGSSQFSTSPSKRTNRHSNPHPQRRSAHRHATATVIDVANIALDTRSQRGCEETERAGSPPSGATTTTNAAQAPWFRLEVSPRKRSGGPMGSGLSGTGTGTGSHGRSNRPEIRRMVSVPRGLAGLLDGTRHDDELCVRFGMSWSELERVLLLLGTRAEVGVGEWEEEPRTARGGGGTSGFVRASLARTNSTGTGAGAGAGAGTGAGTGAGAGAGSSGWRNSGYYGFGQADSEEGGGGAGASASGFGAAQFPVERKAVENGDLGRVKIVTR